MHDALPLQERATVKQLITKLLKESVVEKRRSDIHIRLLRRHLGEIETGISLGPALQVWKVFPCDVIVTTYY